MSLLYALVFPASPSSAIRRTRSACSLRFAAYAAALSRPADGSSLWASRKSCAALPYSAEAVPAFVFILP